MINSDTPNDGELSDWVDGKAEALKFQLGETFPVTPTELHTAAVPVETSAQKLEEVLLEHESPTPEFLAELQALKDAQPLTEEELAQQALEAGGADGDKNTPE